MQNPARRLLLLIAPTMMAVVAGGCSVSDLGLADRSPRSSAPAAETTEPSSTTTTATTTTTTTGSTGGEVVAEVTEAATPIRLSTDPTAVYRTGTCLDVPAPGSEPTAVGCDLPHRIEVYAVQRLPGGPEAPFLGLEAAVGLCDEHFFRATGVGIGLATVLDRSVLRPSEATWSAGERDVICHVVYPAPIDRPLTAVDPTRGFGRVSIYGLRTGDCLVDFDRSSTSFGLAPCDQPHNAEVFAAIPLDPGDFPGDAEIVRITDEHCFGPTFEQFVGTPYAASAITSLASRPTEDTWVMGHHTIGCILTDDLERTGSFAGSAR